MNQIQIRILEPEQISHAERMAVTAARITQRGHKIQTMEEFLQLYQHPYSNELLENLCNLPHPTLQKFGVIDVAVIGASRRFLAQITRHQNEVKFMSGSLQYSDYSDHGAFVVPDALIGNEAATQKYLDACENAMRVYKDLAKIDNDAAGYVAPQGLRNVLLISATPYQWKHMIRQRVCRRNTEETRYVMLKIWAALYTCSPGFFAKAGPGCMYGEGCKEGSMSCGHTLEICKNPTPQDILYYDFPHIYGLR